MTLGLGYVQGRRQREEDKFEDDKIYDVRATFKMKLSAPIKSVEGKLKGECFVLLC